MSTSESPIDKALLETLLDHRLSRGERQALTLRVEELAKTPAELDEVRNRAFALARTELGSVAGTPVLEWLEGIVRMLDGIRRPKQREPFCEAVFRPGGDCATRIASLFRGAAETADACVFTITDNRITEEILKAHRRGVVVRVVTDDEKRGDPGSDIDRLERAGVPVAQDTSPFHMHHKFAVFDGGIAVTGSYNWTRGASERNQENIVVTEDPRLVLAFAGEFERLWAEFGAGSAPR